MALAPKSALAVLPDRARFNKDAEQAMLAGVDQPPDQPPAALALGGQIVVPAQAPLVTGSFGKQGLSTFTRNEWPVVHI